MTGRVTLCGLQQIIRLGQSCIKLKLEVETANIMILFVDLMPPSQEQDRLKSVLPSVSNAVQFIIEIA